MQPSKQAALLDNLRRAMAAHQAGQLDQAEFSYRAVLAADRRNVDAMHLLGVLLGQRGRFVEAEELIGRALKINASRADMHANHARVLNELRRHDAALRSADRAVAIDARAIDAWTHRGVALQYLGRSDEALESFTRAISVARDHVPALMGRSIVLMNLGRAAEALGDCDRALALRPRHLQARLNRGYALVILRRHDEALAAFDAALALVPDSPEALDGRTNMLALLGRPREALAPAERLVTLRPDFPYARGQRLHLAMQSADWRNVDSDVEAVARGIENGQRMASPFSLLGIIGDAALQRRCAEIYAADRWPAATVPLWRGERYAHERIRVAYVSADFGEHPVSRLLAGAIERHDRQRFEVIAVSLQERPAGPLRDRIHAAADTFIDGGQLDGPAIAARMRELEIDIAVDLMGHTGSARTDIFAARPAPIQVNYLGYPGTMGAGYVDYIIADPFVVPAGAEERYSEKILRLPETFQANDASRPIAEATPSREAEGLPANGFVFCAFNATYKITPSVFAVWMRLLQAIEGSVIWHATNDPDAVANLRAATAQAGIDPARIVIAGRAPYGEYLARYRIADLALDTSPFNGGTTTSDALFAGLPVVALAGEGFAARMAASLLTTLGLGALVAGTPAEYEATALRLARDPALLGDLRARLAAARSGSALFDAGRFCRHLEAGYAAIHARHMRGEAPASVDVAPLP